MAEEQGTDSGEARRTRPASADRRAARRNGGIQRYTVDLDKEQRRALAMRAADWEVDKSRIVRTLLYLLEADEALRKRVRDELFVDDDGRFGTVSGTNGGAS